MEVFLVYLWLKLDMFQTAFRISGILLMCVWMALYLVYAMEISSGSPKEKEDYKNTWLKKAKTFFIIGTLLNTMSIVLPDSKGAAILVGTAYAVDLAKSPEGTKVVTLIRAKANQFLDEQIKEATSIQPKKD